MSEAPPNTAKSLYATLKDDVQVVHRDVKQRGIRRVLGEPITRAEEFYLTSNDRERLAAMRPLRRTFSRTWWLFRGLLLKLTPARRILLALGIWFMITAPEVVQLHGTNRFSIRVPWLGGGIILTILMLELKDKLTARDELEAGRRVQLALLPEQRPAIPGWDVWLYTQPANDVGGDLVDHLQLDEQRHVVALGDVAGKALPAALLSVKLQATLRALAPQFDNLADLGSAVNRILFRDGLPTRFASLVHLVVTTESGRVRLLNAGHMPPLVVRNGGVVPTERGSMVLGIMPDATFWEQAIDVERGETLVVYSDGVSEAMNEAGDFFGDDRLIEAIRQAKELSAEAMATNVLDAVKHFVGHAVPNDDLSLLVLRRLPEGEVVKENEGRARVRPQRRALLNSQF